MIRDLFEVWDALADGDALPEELYVVELGVGNGTQARSSWTSSGPSTPRTGATITGACTT